MTRLLIIILLLGLSILGGPVVGFGTATTSRSSIAFYQQPSLSNKAIPPASQFPAGWTRMGGRCAGGDCYHPAGAHSRHDRTSIEELVEPVALPDTLLLYSADWYGPKLGQAARSMGLALADDRLAELEATAVRRAVNTRLLLAIARLEDAAKRYRTSQEWRAWLSQVATRIRTALGPFALDDIPTFQFRDGTHAVMRPGKTNTAYWALITIIGLDRTAAETEQALQEFLRSYSAFFGNPARDEAQPVASEPFLYKPYRGELTGRGYYDHTYPSVDNGGTPNVPGMLDYLGRSHVSYDTHDADDFGLPYGSDVYAPAPGTVLYVGNETGDSLGLLIRYTDTSYDIYIGHLSEVFVSFGQVVTRGQLIAKSGMLNSISHIHFEVRHNGKQTDTMGWYGDGPDPCPMGPGSNGGYKGCEASAWLWADEPPPTSVDATPPDGRVVLNNGWGSASRVDIPIDLAATDQGSGVRDVRLSNDGSTWSDWQPLASRLWWRLTGRHGDRAQVFVQFRDHAGNIATVSDSIMLDFYPRHAASRHYCLTTGTISVGGGASQSAGYRLNGTSGQPLASGAFASSQRYRASVGLWPQLDSGPAADCSLKLVWLPLMTDGNF